MCGYFRRENNPLFGIRVSEIFIFHAGNVRTFQHDSLHSWSHTANRSGSLGQKFLHVSTEFPGQYRPLNICAGSSSVAGTVGARKGRWGGGGLLVVVVLLVVLGLLGVVVVLLVVLGVELLVGRGVGMAGGSRGCCCCCCCFCCCCCWRRLSCCCCCRRLSACCCCWRRRSACCCCCWRLSSCSRCC